MKIAIGSDHTAITLKKELIQFLKQKNIKSKDFGPFSEDRVDYCDYGFKIGEVVASGEYQLGIVLCGTGVGISISANKVKGIRAVVCSEPYSAALSKRHNNTNILAIGARVVGTELAKMIVEQWLDASFEGGRHAKRVEKIMNYER